MLWDKLPWFSSFCCVADDGTCGRMGLCQCGLFAILSVTCCCMPWPQTQQLRATVDGYYLTDSGSGMWAWLAPGCWGLPGCFPAPVRLLSSEGLAGLEAALPRCRASHWAPTAWRPAPSERPKSEGGGCSRALKPVSEESHTPSLLPHWICQKGVTKATSHSGELTPPLRGGL